MAKTSWGIKRTCPCGNGVRFYDLNKKDIECPSCGESINIEKLSIAALESNLRKKPRSQILGENKNVGIKDKNLSNTKNLDVKIDTDNIPKTKVDVIIGKKVKDKKKKN